ncbi:GntR family transcriptional regulator [Limnochorda pilosa]|uniref:GntR family transcriptional regulator n=1 Tax=Limnochorda pilosa TaxID=1555112 RepID=A0A0K2SQX6_LIMPI|nr:GntR family transcriptional regulator [Limnochorda pilosa]BAS29412.1 GntR family transcriptional regulator [Limnochorda pilosa]
MNRTTRRLSPIKLDQYKPLRELVFERLRAAIIAGELHPGERLMEIQLAEDLGVSRTPVREAIRKLELEGFVVMIPRKGAYVADISLKDVADVFEIRGALEALAAELAAERATDEELDELERALIAIGEVIGGEDMDELVSRDTYFHELIYRASRNARLGQMTSLLSEQIQRFRTRTLAHPTRARTSLKEHYALVEAMRARDPELARRTAKAHIESAEQALMLLISQEEETARRHRGGLG